MTSQLNNVIQKAYKVFVPRGADIAIFSKTAEDTKRLLEEKAKKAGIDVEIRFGGSYSKNTWVKGESDIDIFAIFGSEKDTKLLKNMMIPGFIEARGSREYFKGRINGITVEVVPLVRFDSVKNVKNSIDLSVLHEKYVREKLNENLRKDIIILKRFCKSNGCYGSETYKHGFSGYALELLVIEYGGILPLLKAVDYWQDGMVIDIEGHYKNADNALESMPKQEAPMLLIDPTNPKRNICGSLNSENLSKFVFACKRFVISPSFSMFQEHDIGKEIRRLSKFRGSKLFTYDTKIIEPRDTFLSKYNKALDRLINELKSNDIEIYNYDVDYREDVARLFLEIKSVPSTSTRQVPGPKVWIKSKNMKEFLKAHDRVYLKGDCLYYDKKYGTKNFNIAIKTSIIKYMSYKAVLKI